MADDGNSRGWALVLAALTSSLMTAVAVLIGLEKMSWVAAGMAVVLGVIALFNGTTGTDGRSAAGGFRLSVSRTQKFMLVGAVIILGAAATFRVIVGPVGLETAACSKPPDPITRAKVFSAPSAAYPDLKIRSMVYNLTYNGMDFMHLEATGQIAGTVPDDQLLYPFGSADPKSRDAFGNPGSGRFFWGRDEQIVPDRDGCWSKPQREFGGYPGARGLTFHYYLGLVSRSQLSCLDKLVSTKSGKEHGQEARELARCGVILLGHAQIPTDPP